MPDKQKFTIPPTDAVLFLGGHNPQPANPIFFLTMEQAAETRQSLIDAGVAPANAKVVENAQELGPVMYGRDDRYVFALTWGEVVDNGEGGQVQELWSVQLGLLYWRWQELIASTKPPAQPGKWRKTPGGSIVRY